MDPFIVVALAAALLFVIWVNSMLMASNAKKEHEYRMEEIQKKYDLEISKIREQHDLAMQELQAERGF